MEKPQLINFIAKVMEDSGFKIYKDFKTSQKIIDIYAILPTTIGDFGVVVACKNYRKDFEIGIEIIKEMEDVGESIKAAKVAIIASCYFTKQAKTYAGRKNIKLVDRDKLLELAKKYQDRTSQTTLDNTPYDGGASDYIREEYPEYEYGAADMEYVVSRREQNPNFYKNTLYKQDNEKRGLAFLNRNNPYHQDPYQTNLYNYNQGSYQSSLLLQLITNPLTAIILVVVISYLVSRISGLAGMDSGYSGFLELLVALLLSYGFALVSERNADFIVKGTFIFFISLIILIILIFI